MRRVRRMEFRSIDLGFATADAEAVQLQFDGANLVLEFVDWREQSVRRVFEGVLAFRWGEDTCGAPRDDMSFEVESSEWLRREAQLQSVRVDDHAHYKLCFNAAGVLDVLAARVAT